MSNAARVPHSATNTVKTGSAAHGGLLLQRKCACGTPTRSLTGECAECEHTKLSARMQAPNVAASVDEDATPTRATADPTIRLSRMSILGVQRKCGCESPSRIANRDDESSRRALRIQAKLKINRPGDSFEEEADRVAESIMGRVSLPAVGKAQTNTDTLPPTEGDLVRGGAPLPPDVAAFYERSFGRDLSGVRIHVGHTASHYNDAVSSYAFTYGSHIWLGHGLHPRPSFILAHELAHVVQQTQPAFRANDNGQPQLTHSANVVQRFLPYWIPAEYVAKGKKVGVQSHQLILPQLGKHNQIFTEAPVPNADSKGVDITSTGVGFDKKGVADLYRASKTVGVYFAGEKLPKSLGSGRDLKFNGERYAHLTNRAPNADERRQSVVNAESAPTEIEVGDLKPSHGTIEALKGPQQVRDYLEGFRLAHREVNAMSVGKGGYAQTDAAWKPLTAKVIDIGVPTALTEPLGTGQDAKRLVLMHNGKPIQPRRTVQGKVFVRPAPGGGGIWNYIWTPVTAVTAADLPASVVRFGTEVTTRIVNPLLVSPVQTARTARPSTRPARLSHAPRLVQARPRDATTTAVKDSFDLARKQEWEADHGRLSGDEKQLERTPDFEEAALQALIVQDRQASALAGFHVSPVSAKENAAAGSVKKIRFWTGASSAFFGKLRHFFGGAFVKVANAYYAVRARFRDMLEKKRAPRSSGLSGTILRIAFDVLTVAGSAIVRRTAQHLVTSLKQGVEQKLKALIPLDRIEEFDAKLKEISDLADDLERKAVETVEALVERTIGPYTSHIDTLVGVANKLSTVSSIVSKVRWGARVLACLSPPGWGCLWILAESVIERFASWLVDRCWFKQEIAPLVTGIEFIAKLPKKLASFIIDQIKAFLPAPLHDVFADIDTSKVATSFLSQEICNDNDRYPRDRAMIERHALAELRNEIGEEKWAAWTRLGELYGVNRGDPLSPERIVQLKEELKRADVGDLKEAAALDPVLKQSRDVTNLTSFLDEAKQMKERMYGSDTIADQHGSAGEGGATIDVASSSTPVGTQYKPTKRRWEVVAGVTKGQYPGAIINVAVSSSIKGAVVTLRDVEVKVRKRQFLPNARRAKQMKVSLVVTREQYFDIAEQYGAAIVNQIGYKSFRYKAKTPLEASLDL